MTSRASLPNRLWNLLGSNLPSVRSGMPEAAFAGLFAFPLIANYSNYRQDTFGFIVEVLVCVSVACIGRWPFTATVATCGTLAVLPVDPISMPRIAPIVVLIAIISLGARGYVAAKVGVSIWLLLVTAWLEQNPTFTIVDNIGRIASWLLLVAIAWLLGWVLLRLVNERLELEKSQAEALSVQRRAIAQDLHDTIAYSTTSIIMRAEQAKLRGTSDDAMSADLEFIIGAGRQSMRDLRSMMETLRRDHSVAIPDSPWQISSLREVLDARKAELEARGFSVTVHVEGQMSEWPDSVHQTLAKVLVEMTGNVLKYGDPEGPCSILVDATGDELEAALINKPLSRSVNTNGLGILGATERVRALGGDLQVTSQYPRWVVQLRIPREV